MEYLGMIMSQCLLYNLASKFSKMKLKEWGLVLISRHGPKDSHAFDLENDVASLISMRLFIMHEVCRWAFVGLGWYLQPD